MEKLSPKKKKPNDEFINVFADVNLSITKSQRLNLEKHRKQLEELPTAEYGDPDLSFEELPNAKDVLLEAPKQLVEHTWTTGPNLVGCPPGRVSNSDSYKPMKKNYSNEKTENSKRDSSFYPGIDSAILKRDAECARKPPIRSPKESDAKNTIFLAAKKTNLGTDENGVVLYAQAGNEMSIDSNEGRRLSFPFGYIESEVAGSKAQRNTKVFRTIQERKILSVARPKGYKPRNNYNSNEQKLKIEGLTNKRDGKRFG